MIFPTGIPQPVYCRICGSELVWEHPKGFGHYQASSDYIDSDICRCCKEELREQSGHTPAALSTTNQDKEAPNTMEFIQMTLFQAPHAPLIEHGLLLKMHDLSGNFSGPVPAQYYMPVFHDKVAITGDIPTDPDERQFYILESFFALYNQDNRPNPMTSRSMSVGDVVKLEGQFFLCACQGFTPITFEAVEWPPVNQLVTPSGDTLQVSIFPNDPYPCINIDLIQKGGEKERVCMVEHNPEKEPGHELCIGVYCADEDETVYYGSYNKAAKSEGGGET